MFPPLIPSRVDYSDDDDDDMEDEEAMTSEELCLVPRRYNVYESLFGPDESESSDEVGTNLSKKERERLNLGTEFVYGEVTYKAMSKILSTALTKSSRYGTFVDFGSGTGKAVFSAALLQPSKFKCCAGAEYMETLHNHACEIRDKHYKTRVKSMIEKMYPDLKMPTIYLEKSDFRRHEWSKELSAAVSDASVLFAHSTMFDKSMLSHLAKITQDLIAHKDTVFVTLSHELPASSSSRWEVVDEMFLDMSWGGCVVYVHRLKRNEQQSS